jgi:hypothetical protein
MKKRNQNSRKRARMTGYRSTRQQAFRQLERLETRAMLAADFSPWHNATLPGDINGDGVVDTIDAEILISELRATGNRYLGGESGLMGGMEGESPLYLDVTNDGMLSSRDLLQVMNALLIEGEPADETQIASFTFRIYDSNGLERTNNIFSLGETFTFEVSVQNATLLQDGGGTGNMTRHRCSMGNSYRSYARYRL